MAITLDTDGSIRFPQISSRMFMGFFCNQIIKKLKIIRYANYFCISYCYLASYLNRACVLAINYIVACYNSAAMGCGGCQSGGSIIKNAFQIV